MSAIDHRRPCSELPRRAQHCLFSIVPSNVILNLSLCSRAPQSIADRHFSPSTFKPIFKHARCHFSSLPPLSRAATADRRSPIHQQGHADLGPHPRQGPWPRPADGSRGPHRIGIRRPGEGAGGVRPRRGPDPIAKDGGEGAVAGGGAGDWQDRVGPWNFSGES